MSNEIIFLTCFVLFIIAILALDLGLFSKKTDVISLKHAAIMSFIMMGLALAFYVILLHFGHLLHGIESTQQIQTLIDKNQHPISITNNLEESIKIYNKNLGLEYLTGLIVEKALSVDNIFVIVLVFTAFGVQQKNYHGVLFWGILGAIIMRFIFIFVGAALIARFGWILYVFGGFLIFTGIKMFFQKEEEEKIDTENHPVVKFLNRFFKVHNQFVEDKFFVTINGVRKITPLFVVLIIIEFTDLIFAVDSIPAIFSVTKDPYIVFFSNIFAILGLRSMFFLLAGIIDKFRYLKVGLAALLVYIGIKMLAHSYLKEIGFTTTHSLYIIVGILAASIIASLLIPIKEEKNTSDFS